MVSPYGIVDMEDGGRVVGFREKVELPHWINGGVYVFDREVFQEFPDLGDHEVETFPRLAEEGANRCPSNAVVLDEYRLLQRPAGSGAVSIARRRGVVAVAARAGNDPEQDSGPLCRCK